MAKNAPSDGDKELRRLRLDKWLWAARFYKTRSVAKQAIDGGKVYCEGTRCKPDRKSVGRERGEARVGRRTVRAKPTYGG